jgi:hypothetical protein
MDWFRVCWLLYSRIAIALRRSVCLLSNRLFWVLISGSLWGYLPGYEAGGI